jgi:hypothetical protein
MPVNCGRAEVRKSGKRKEFFIHAALLLFLTS